MESLIGRSQAQLRDLVESMGEKPFRARQIYSHLYRRQSLDIAQWTDMAAAFRARLSEQYTASPPAVERESISSDGTTKYLFRFLDGEAVEAVCIPDEDRVTLCISTQVGCAMGCRFCATAGLGFKRNLTAGEIVGQYLAIAALKELVGRTVNIVFMGMGEPLQNIDNLLVAFDILNDPDGVALSRRGITVSTCGLVDAMKELGRRSSRPRLAISLNATTDEVRSRIMPVNRLYPLSELLEVCRTYPLLAGERITFEYILMRDLNDSDEDARRLVRILRGIHCKINLIPYNESDGLLFRSPDPERVEAFRNILVSKHYTALTRKSRGRDIQAACGQLAAESGKPTVDSREDDTV